MSGAMSVQAIISGRVQGVFFRSFVAEHAQELGLGGYVRNLSGGEVEVLAEGDRERLEKLVGYLRTGPPDAIVKDVAVTWSAYTGKYSGFRISY
ncbi:MAG: acylphosphatase [Chloroflexi bacterium]|nr:acylphosphatase [Chloroflexota bacterium]